MQKPSWYLNRLARMSPMEVAYRARKAARNTAMRYGALCATRVPPADLSAETARVPHPAPRIDAQPYVRAAEQAAAGRMRVFALTDAPVGRTGGWNRDPLTGTAAPLVFGPTMDYRDERLVGNIKYLWEPNRHLQLVSFAQAYALTGDMRHLHALQAELDSWFEQCPYLRGPNWSSALELGIRLINWSLVWKWIGGSECALFGSEAGRAFRDRWLRSVYQHAHFLAGHLSAYSSANNHLIGEAAGLFVAATTWPFWKRTHAWRDLGYSVLIREAVRQTTADGVNREQAISYQQFVLDFLLLAMFAGADRGIEFPASYRACIEGMLEFLASLMDVGGNVPMIGDGDDGYAVQLAQQEDFCPYRSLLTTGAVLFDRPEFLRKARMLDDKTRWLLGPDAETRFAALAPVSAPALPVRQAFPEGGYYVLGREFETPREMRLVMDAGPLGYLSIAAHGHADALALTLSVGGHEILIDPGTYSYHTERRWRDYFRGTAAHNTVVVDGLDQSVIGGSFMWMRHACTQRELWSSTPAYDEIAASHDGFLRLDDPVRHHRHVRLDKAEGRVSIADRLTCSGAHVVERYWHFAEAAAVTADEHGIRVVRDGIEVEFRAHGAAIEPFCLRASEDPIGGWVSRSFDVKVPGTTVVWRSRIAGDTELGTEIRCRWLSQP